MKQTHKLVEIWGDVVSPLAMIFSMMLSVITTMAGYLLSSSYGPTAQLFFGILGAVVGFIINALLIKPKRIIKVDKS